MSKTLYQVVVVALLLTQMGVVMGLASPGLSDTDVGVVTNQMHLPVILSSAVAYSIVLLRLLVHPRRYLSALRSIWIFIPIVMYALLSTTWSSNPAITLRRSAFLALSTIIAFILGTDFELPELTRLFAGACLIHMALCAVFLAFSPHFLYSPSDPLSLKGLTTHKNIFGMEQGLATIAFLLVPFRRLEKFRIPFAVLAFMLLLLSHSAGALVATCTALFAVPLLLILRFSGSQRVPLVVGASASLAVVSYLAIENVRLLPTLLSKDPTLTGRTELWSLVLIAIQAHPLLGYGFDSFWQGLQGNSLAIIRGVGWLVPTAHNGYLDLLLSAGYLGALLFLPILMQTVARSLRYAADEAFPRPASARFFPFAFLIFFLVYNLNESDLLTRSGLPFLLWVAISVSLGVRQRLRQYPQQEKPDMGPYGEQLAVPAP